MASGILLNEDGTYTVYCDNDCIRTTVTDCGAAVDAWLDEILRIHRRRINNLIVGLDVEWRPNLQNGGLPNPVAVLQLSVGRRCLVFQILRANFLPISLFDFLADERFLFVGVGVANDARYLQRDFYLEVARTIDLGYLAAECLHQPEMKRAGLQSIVKAVMDLHVEKPRPFRTGRWDAQVLSTEQIRYACIDAFVSFEVGRRLFMGHY